MTDFELEQLSQMWREPQDPAEVEALRRSADTVARRARWAQIVDVAVAALVAGVVIILVLASPQFDTFLVGGAAIVVLLVNQIRQRRLRQIELRSLTGTAEEMLDQSIERLQAKVKHTRVSMFAFIPAFAFGIFIAAMVERSAGQSFLREAVAEWWLRPAWLAAALLAGAALLVVGALQLRRCRRELERLEATREAYRQERRSAEIE